MEYVKTASTEPRCTTTCLALYMMHIPDDLMSSEVQNSTDIFKVILIKNTTKVVTVLAMEVFVQ